LVTNQAERVLTLYRQLLESWNTRNADTLAAAFSDEGSCVGFDGSMMNGRAEIASTLRGIFEHHPTARYVAKVREVRPLAPGVVLLRSVVGMVPPGKDELKPDVNAIQSLVIVTRGPDTKVALLQNTPAAFHGRPELAQQLTSELTDVLRSGQILAADLLPSASAQARKPG
jgi:uncharacterized protein (TIGR02246 family)